MTQITRIFTDRRNVNPSACLPCRIPHRGRRLVTWTSPMSPAVARRGAAKPESRLNLQDANQRSMVKVKTNAINPMERSCHTSKTSFCFSIMIKPCLVLMPVSCYVLLQKGNVWETRRTHTRNPKSRPHLSLVTDYRPCATWQSLRPAPPSPGAFVPLSNAPPYAGGSVVSFAKTGAKWGLLTHV